MEVMEVMEVMVLAGLDEVVVLFLVMLDVFVRIAFVRLVFVASYMGMKSSMDCRHKADTTNAAL